MTVKEITAKAKNNVVGAIVGAGLSYVVVKKYTGISGTWKLVGIALVGALVGAYAQSAIKARSSKPKASTTK